MPLNTHDTSENSVTFSLAELAKLEEERLRDEDANRARTREREARERREAAAARRAEEEQKLAAEAEAKAKRAREEAEEKARIEARQQAALHVARIEAEAKARLEAENAVRAHELAVVKARAELGRSRTQTVLAVALGLVLCGGAFGALRSTQQISGLEKSAEELRDQQGTLARELERAKESQLAALDRRYEALRASPMIREAEETRATVEAARNAIDPKALNHDRLRAFSDAINALEKRLDALGKLAALDKRSADIVAWAGERKQQEVADTIRSAADRARAQSGNDDALRGYETALDQARSSLTKRGAGAGVGGRPPVTGPTRTCAYEGDPLCGLNGQSL